MKLFIDTNIFLSFFHYTSDDLEELAKLTTLVKNGHVELLIPQQTRDEFARNREVKIADAIKRLRDQRLNLQFPQIAKDYPEYTALRDLQRQYERNHAELIRKITDDVKQISLNADELIRELFNNSTLIPTSDELLRRAKDRVDIGNPPGKRGSLGDAINWEAILETVLPGDDLYFVTDDKDYYSPVDDREFNSYLKREWSDNKQADLIYFRQISRFFQDHFPDINLVDEAEKDALIHQLALSSSFAQTHSIVADLAQYSEFSPTQLENIIDGALSNTQVYWIINDYDVERFLYNIVELAAGVVDDVKIGQIKDMLLKDEETGDNS